MTITTILIIAALVWFGFKVKAFLAPPKALPETFVVFDLETTGLKANRDDIIEIGAIRVHKHSKNAKTYQTLVKPRTKIPKDITDITGITDSMIEAEGIALEEAMKGFIEFIGDSQLVAFNADFDVAFIEQALKRCDMGGLRNTYACALKMARRAWPGKKSYKLATLAKERKLDLSDSHRAIGDCKRALAIYVSAVRALNKSH